jgi:hypothetical protein
VSDNRRENLIQNCIRNPSLVDYDPSVGWNNRAAIPERKLYCYCCFFLVCSRDNELDLYLTVNIDHSCLDTLPKV